MLKQNDQIWKVQIEKAIFIWPKEKRWHENSYEQLTVDPLFPRFVTNLPSLVIAPVGQTLEQ